jgi:uncharacterized NAD-dependent epimerase/dehydratase family protein
VVIDGVALVYCDEHFDTIWGKTAHGLVRFTERYHVAALVDSTHVGEDAGEVLDGIVRGIPIFGTIDDAVAHYRESENPITHLVFGIATDGGRLTEKMHSDLLWPSLLPF